MSKNIRHIIALLLVIVPFYLGAFLRKVLLDKADLMAEEFLGYYMLLSFLGIAVVLLINKYLLKNSLKAFLPAKGKFIYDLSLAFLLLGMFFFIQSLGRITYVQWIPQYIDRTAITELLNSIFSNFVHGVIIIGPFVWSNEIFAVLSLAFILNNFWALNDKKSWSWFIIFFASLLFSLLQIDNGIAAIIDSFLLVSFSNYIYYHYRSIWPLLIAAILFQTIDLITYWVYVI